MRKRRREAGPPLTQQAIDRIEELCAKRGWSRERLALKSGLSPRRIQDWLGTPGRRAAKNGAPIRPRHWSASCVAEALGVTVDELFGPPPSHAGSSARPTSVDDFMVLARIAREVDDELIDITRRLSKSPVRTIRSAYRSVLNDQLARRGFTLDTWIAYLQSFTTHRAIVASLPRPGLILDVSPDFGCLTFGLPDGRQLRVPEPQLLWDCACQTPDTRQGPDQCPIHSHELGDSITAAFNTGLVTIQWRDVSILWSNVRDLWPPSIDSFTFLMDLYESGLLKADIQSILDLGSGTGFLGIAVTRHNARVERLTLADWLLTPSLYGAVNWALNSAGREQVALSLRIGMFSDWLVESPTAGIDDVALCNPPYLPLLPGFEEFGVHAVVAGTDLLMHVIENAPSLGRRVFTQFSNLAKKDATDVASRHRVRLKALKPRPRPVPFRVRRAWTEMPEYFDALRSLKNGLKVKRSNRHPYWHSLQSFEVVSSHR